MTYIKLFVDYLDAVEPLGDAERGRLFTALLEYARTGAVPQLGGNERFLFPMMRAQIDRDRESAEGLSEKRSESGKKGGRPKKQTEAKKAIAFSESKKSKDKDEDKDKDENKDEDNDEDNDHPTLLGRSAVVAVYLDRINPSASQTSIQELCAFADEMGDEVCLRAFDIALDSKKATWPYIRGILRKWQAAGVKCLADIAEKDSKPGNKPKNGPACSDYKSPDAVAQMKKDLDDLARFAGG